MVGLDPEGPTETLHSAWRDGFGYADTAPLYGDAEEILGYALRRWDGQRPIVATKTKRSTDIEEVKARFARSRANLGGIDLLAVHDATPDYPQQTRESTSQWIRGLLDQREIVAAGLGGGGPQTQEQWLGFGLFRYVLTHLRLDPITLQGIHDTVPLAKRAGAAVIAASPMHRGLFGPRHPVLCDSPPPWLNQVQVRRARNVERLANEWRIPLSQLAVRFVLSLPMVDLVLTGAKSMREWEDVLAAYHAGPLPSELYSQLWLNAQDGAEPADGG
jgi:aryl-alcohol dehydrogenase-like predicted oxidoreductase